MVCPCAMASGKAANKVTFVHLSQEQHQLRHPRVSGLRRFCHVSRAGHHLLPNLIDAPCTAAILRA
eukprot:scaffold101769_cov24-Tisochrysis_lutea.AAC.1